MALQGAQTMARPMLRSIEALRPHQTAAKLCPLIPQRSYQRNRRYDPSKIEQDRRKAEENAKVARQLTRDWHTGDVYAPHDISAAEMRKWKKKHRPTTDAFDALSIDPLSMYKNFSVMSEYMTDMGRIRHSSSTGLRPVNQRKIAKAIRRAIALGLMPSVHKHPEIIKSNLQDRKIMSGGRFF